MYVCMSQICIHTYKLRVAKITVSKDCLTVYVCLRTLCPSWTMNHTRSNMHSQMPSRNINKCDYGSAWPCMYVWKPSACHGKWNLHTQTYMLNFHWRNMTKLMSGGSLSRMYVWKPSACHGKRNIHARPWTWEFNLNYRKLKKTRPLSRIRHVRL